MRPDLVGTCGCSALKRLQQVERPLVIGARAGLAVQARHGFQVVVEHVRRLRRQTLAARTSMRPRKSGTSTSIVVVWASVRARRAMQSAKWPAPPSRRSSRSTEVITTYFSVISAIASASWRGSSVSERLRLAVGHIAERAAPGADIAHDHEGRGAVAEALAEVRAHGLLADRAELALAQDLLDPTDAGAGWWPGANPVRLALDLGGWLHLDRDPADLVVAALMGFRAGA